MYTCIFVYIYIYIYVKYIYIYIYIYNMIFIIFNHYAYLRENDIQPENIGYITDIVVMLINQDLFI